jgi:hypothetical protein
VSSSGRRPTFLDVLDLLRRWAASDYPGEPPGEIEVRWPSGRRLVFPIPADSGHSPDFRSVRWRGEDHTFSEPQARAVRVLWEAAESGCPDVGGEALTEAAGTESHTARDVFKGHSAWGTLIVSSGRGIFRLADGAAAAEAD